VYCDWKKLFELFREKLTMRKELLDMNVYFITASENGYTEVVKLLLADTRANPAVDDNRAIQRASRNVHTEVVELLYDLP